MYNEIMKKILENGKQASVRIGDQVLPATEFNGYYVIATQNGLRIFDGEHLIEPDFRVFDTHLKQYIYYDYPVEKLLKTFGFDKSNVKINQDIDVPTMSRYPPKVMKMKLITGFIGMVLFFGVLYMLFTGSNDVYYLMLVAGINSMLDSIIDKKYLKKVNKLNLIGAIGAFAIGLYGIIFVL